ncbi:MAG: hypothetical protein JOZ92_09860 [Candidatus Dormibacteraeota bacterium]|nr:hypothetical protein [Candidatus Dormibacteraeota bacterium]
MSVSRLLADVPESHFQAAWYYSIVLAAMVTLMALGGGWIGAGVLRIWRAGDRAAAMVIAGAAAAALLFFGGALLAGIVGLINTNGQG